MAKPIAPDVNPKTLRRNTATAYCVLWPSASHGKDKADLRLNRSAIQWGSAEPNIV